MLAPFPAHRRWSPGRAGSWKRGDMDLILQDPGLRIVLITAPGPEKAVEVADALVGEGLVACVNIVPTIRSVYRWKGEIHSDSETLMIGKARAENAADIARRVKELHPYECPEVLFIPVAEGIADYVRWVLNPG